MDSLATIEDYAARYGEPGDADRAAILLGDATALLLSAYEAAYGVDYEPGAHLDFDRGASAVCCQLVHRVLTAPAAMMGATQYSQGAGGYSASVTYGSALGELYMGKSDLKRLGLDGQALRAIHPREGGGD